MSVSLLIISHEEIGTALVNTVKTTFGDKLTLPISTVELQPAADPDILIPKLKKVVSALDEGEGVLILADLYGSTPSNIAQALKDNTNIRIVTGLNLPMLLRVINYLTNDQTISLDEIAEKALIGGQNGIRECEAKEI